MGISIIFYAVCFSLSLGHIPHFGIFVGDTDAIIKVDINEGSSLIFSG